MIPLFGFVWSPGGFRAGLVEAPLDVAVGLPRVSVLLIYFTPRHISTAPASWDVSEKNLRTLQCNAARQAIPTQEKIDQYTRPDKGRRGMEDIWGASEIWGAF